MTTVSLFTRPWEQPELTHLNRLPMRATLVPYETTAQALSFNPGKSPWYKSLNGSWKFRLVKNPEAVPANFFQPAASESGFEPITVPGNWTMQGYDKPHYTNAQMPWKNDPPFVPQDDNPTGLYRRTFTVPKEWKNRRIVLHFGGVESVLHLYVNGHQVGMSKDSRLPAEFDVTPYVKPGANMLAAMVIRYSDASYIEDQDHWRMAGIYRDVYLYSELLKQFNFNAVSTSHYPNDPGQRKKVVFRAHKLMECSVSHFTADDLFNAFHTNELQPRQEVIVNLDYRQRGLGTGSCGPQTLEKYQVKPGAYEFGYTIAVEPGSGKG